MDFTKKHPLKARFLNCFYPVVSANFGGVVCKTEIEVLTTAHNWQNCNVSQPQLMLKEASFMGEPCRADVQGQVQLSTAVALNGTSLVLHVLHRAHQLFHHDLSGPTLILSHTPTQTGPKSGAPIRILPPQSCLGSSFPPLRACLGGGKRGSRWTRHVLGVAGVAAGTLPRPVQHSSSLANL